jgi:hypothetical protein
LLVALTPCMDAGYINSQKELRLCKVSSMAITKGVQIVTDTIKGQKELIGSIIAVVVMTITAWGWASSEFVTTAKAKEMMTKAQHADIELSEQIVELSKDIKASNALLLVHIDRYTLDNVKGEIKANQSQTFALQQFIRVNGSDNQSENRLQQLKTERGDLELKKSCIINHNPLCD